MRKILIVEDNKYMKVALSLLVEESGFKPIVAQDCETAYKNVESESPNLVLLDKKLPDGDGIGLLERIKNLKPEIPVIMLSAYSDFSYAELAMKSGAYAFITKPFDNNEIMGLIKNAAME